MRSSKEYTVEDGDVRLYRGSFKKSLHKVSEVLLELTSPPFNLGGNRKKDAKNRNAKTGAQSATEYGVPNAGGYHDNMPEPEYQASQSKFILWSVKRLAQDGVLIYNHKKRKKGGRLILPTEWIDPLVKSGDVVLKDKFIWNRSSTHNNGPDILHPCHEYLYVLCKPGARPYFKQRGFWWESVEYLVKSVSEGNDSINFVIKCFTRLYSKMGTIPVPNWFVRHLRRFLIDFKAGLYSPEYAVEKLNSLGIYSKNKSVTDVWTIPIEGTKKGESRHCAPFPEKLARQVVLMWSRPGDLVIDPYSGSGTTMLSCLKTGRKFVGSELQSKYFDMTVARIDNFLTERNSSKKIIKLA